VLDRGIETLAMHCKADAILASNDIWAVRFILRLKEIGMRVPEDVAIVGYDNLDIGGVISPSLTTIDQCHEGYAAAAIGLLLRLARNDRIPRAERTLTVTPHLVIRDSS